jgi:hypothetical protein
MAGRPRKDPDGLVQRNFAVPRALDAAFKEGAAAHGLTLVDYFAALVAADRRRPELGPAIQEVFDLRSSA